jgi:hypothetical protein
VNLQQVLPQCREKSFSERDKGDRFERLMRAFLKTAPEYEGNLTCFEGNISHKYRLAVLGNPDQMQIDGKNTVRFMTIFAHVPQLKQEMLKLPAKAGGFAHPKVGR